MKHSQQINKEFLEKTFVKKAAIQALPVIKKFRVSDKKYDVCPHCHNEIIEKSVFFDMDGIYGQPEIWYHRACSKPISFPDENKKGQTFYFRIRTFGKIDNKHDFGECHPECEYLSWKESGYGFCKLFKKDLGKCRCKYGSGAIRCSECQSATDGQT
jgi:hypothetical protein